MRKIPSKLRDLIAEDPWMKACCICGRKQSDGFKIDWHHVFMYAGTQINEIFNILPACTKCHEKAETSNKAKFQAIALSRTTSRDLELYPLLTTHHA